MRSSAMIHSSAPTEVEPDPSEQSAGLPSSVVRRPSAGVIGCEPNPVLLIERGKKNEHLAVPTLIGYPASANHRTQHDDVV